MAADPDMPEPATVTDRFAGFVATIRDADLPEPVRHEGCRAFLNILGCMLGGSDHPTVDVVSRSLLPFSGPPQATLVGRGVRADALHASLINCLSSCVHTFDDAHAEAVVHPAGPVAAAALAVAELRPVTGAAFLTAFVLGMEAVCRLSKAVSVAPATGSIAWSQTGIAGGFGAAVAAGRLLGLDTAGIASATALAVIQASGIRVAQGTMASSLMPAQAAQAGLQAAILAAGGLATRIDALGGRFGFLEVYSRTPAPDWLTDRLGERYEVLANTYKPFPCGIVINPVIEALLALRHHHAIDHGSVGSVELTLNPKAIALTNRRHPVNGTAAQVSFHHWAAVALLHGAADLRHLAESVVQDPVVKALRDKVQAVPADDLPTDCVDVAVKLTDGTILRRSIRHCVGSFARPMSDSELEAKFTSLAQQRLTRQDQARLMGRCWQLAKQIDMKEIVQSAAGTAPSPDGTRQSG